jgi:hypothetical protein
MGIDKKLCGYELFLLSTSINFTLNFIRTLVKLTGLNSSLAMVLRWELDKLLDKSNLMVHLPYKYHIFSD